MDCEDWFTALEKLRVSVQQKVTKLHDHLSGKFRKEYKLVVYQPGDKVWVRNSKLRTKSTKLDPLWCCPCEIIERVAHTGRYRVALPQGEDDVHLEDMKPYVTSIEGKAIPCLFYQPKNVLPTCDSHMVDKILAHRSRNGRHEWKVRWQDYGPERDTWEPASSFVGFIQKDWKEWNKDNKIILNFHDL